MVGHAQLVVATTCCAEALKILDKLAADLPSVTAYRKELARQQAGGKL